MNAKRTSTKVDSSTRLRTTRRPSKRVSKLALFRVKVATIGLSLVAFVASLLSIAAYNPGVAKEAATPVQPQTITIVQSGGSVPLQLAPPPRVNAVRPFVRSRGS
jgi:hypothetical protein